MVNTKVNANFDSENVYVNQLWFCTSSEHIFLYKNPFQELKQNLGSYLGITCPSYCNFYPNTVFVVWQKSVCK